MITVVKAGQAETELQKKSGATSHTTEALPAQVFEGPTAELAVDMSFTKNLGNYESARLRVALSVPVANNVAALNDQFLYAKTWVEDRLTDLVKELEKSK